MIRSSQKGDTPMTDKDRDNYMEVLLALAGFGNIKDYKENEQPEDLSVKLSVKSEKPCE